jgi:hypothetical protein
LDFAQISNGYVYHTKFDRQELIPMESLQNTGNNILPLTMAVANSEELPSTQVLLKFVIFCPGILISFHTFQEYGGGEAVFFDFLGWFLVYYNTSVEIAINLIVMILALVGIGFSIFIITKTHGILAKRIECLTLT